MVTQRLMRALALCALFCAGLPAQVVRLANHSTAPYAGWKRVTVDVAPPHAAGRVGDVRYVVGLPTGRRTRAVDLHVTLAASQQITVDLAAATPEPFARGPLPVDLLAHFGGPMTLAGNLAAVVSVEPDGAGYTAEMRARAGRMLCSHAWITFYPDQPAWAQGEVLLIASNPTVPDLDVVAPVDVRLAFGDAWVWIPGAGLGGRLLAAGQQLADGQARALPFTMIWPRHLQRASDWSSVGAVIDLAVCGVGLQRLWSDVGNPLMPVSFSGRAWAGRNWSTVVHELHTRTSSQIGPHLRSNDAGGFEAQTYHVGGEAMVADGVGAEVVRYLSAIRAHAIRPSHELELDGRPLDLAVHPNYLGWDSRGHWHGNVNKDALGKPRDAGNRLIAPSLEQTGGAWGQDVQHTYDRDLGAASQLVASRLAQRLLEFHVTDYLAQRTATPGWSTTGWDATTGPESAREWACEADQVLVLWDCLARRDLAELVAARWRARVLNVLVPGMAGRDLLKIWDGPTRDHRVNPVGPGVQWWQESFASAAIMRTCRAIGPTQGLAIAERVARRVLDVAWRLDGTRWRAQPQGPLDGSANDANPATFGMNAYGMPGCVWAVLQVEPGSAKARAIWSQLLAEPGETARRWMLPLGVN